ncbi:MAG: hypothetical protein ACLQKA_22125 [Bryobacteraceae bacterium]
MTLLAVLAFIAILYYCGLGPTLLLFPSKPSPWRLAVVPALGLCAHVAFSIFFAQFWLAGKTISTIALPFFGVLAALGWRRSRLSRAELRAAAPVVLLGLFSTAAFGWPLMYRGMQNYWGLANPDQAFLVPVMEWVHTHAIGVPPQYAAAMHHLGAFRDIPVATLIAVFYVTSTLSLITAIPIGLLFNVTALGLVYLVPGGVYALAEASRLPQRVCLAASVLVACSSLVAYTFYLDSLGAVSAIAIMPAACALTLEFVGRPRPLSAAPLVLVCASMFYDYPGMIGMLGVLVGTALVYGVLTRAIPLRQALLFAGSTAALVLVLFAPFAASTLRMFLAESSGSRFAALDESMMPMALTFTERGVPFFWGLRLPSAGAWPFGQSLQAALLVSAVFCLLLLFACCSRRSPLPNVFRFMLAAVIGVILLYAHRKIGYGVFKLDAWVHPLMVVAFTASVFALSDWLFARKRRVLGWLMLCALPLYAVPNLALAMRIGVTTAFPKSGLAIHNAPDVSFRDVLGLSPVAERWGPEGIVATLPDTVVSGWAKSYLNQPGADVQFFPFIYLIVDDSQPRPAADLPPGRFLLHWNDPGLDVVPLPSCPAVWSDPALALSPLEQCRNALVVGKGWYRTESSPWMARFRWLRKRGELLLIHPVSRAQRLRIALMVGPGNPSPSRTISVLLNGALVDRLSITGASQVMTKAFVAPGPSSQIEILVEEDASPLPRSGALWDRWVPGEARPLNVAVADMSLVDANADTLSASSFDVTSGFGSGTLFNGIFLDRWMAAEASITLATPAPLPTGLSVIGTAPGDRGLTFPFHLTPSVNGVPLPDCEIVRAGSFQVRCPMPDAIRNSLQPGQPVRVDLRAGTTYSGGADPRRLSLRLDRIELVPGSPER